MDRPYLQLDDQALLDQCDVHTYKASGPGGQHRNKVSSAVRLRHRPTGITAHGDDSRSQHANRRLALRRLRMNLACQVRQGVDLPRPSPPPGWEDFLAPSRQGQPGRLVISPNNDRFWIVAAYILDVLAASQGRLSDAAAVLGLTASNLTKVLQSERHALQAAQEVRKAFGLKSLR